MSKSANNFTPVRTIKFKMYKAKKQWLMAALAFMAGAAMMTDLTTVSADDNATQSSTVQTNTGDSSISLVTEGTNGDFSTYLVNNLTSSTDNVTSISESDGNDANSLSAVNSTSASSLSTGSNDNSSEAAATSTIGTLKKTDTLQSVDDALSAGYVATGANETIASNIADKTDAQAIADEYVGAHVGVDIDQFYSFDQWQNLSVQGVNLYSTEISTGSMQSNNSSNRSFFTGTINLAEAYAQFKSIDGSTTLTAEQVQSFLDYVHNNLTVTNSTTGDTYVLGDFVSFNGTQKVDSIYATGYFPVLDKNGVIAQDAQGNALSFYTTLAAGDSIYKNSDLYISFGSSEVIPTYSVVAPVFDATVPMESESASTSESTSSESASLSNSTSLSESTSSESASLSNSTSLSESTSSESASDSTSASTSVRSTSTSLSGSTSTSTSVSDSTSTSTSLSGSTSASTSVSDSTSTSTSLSGSTSASTSVSNSASTSTSASDSISTSVSDSASTSTSVSDSASTSTSLSDSASTSTSLSGSTSASTSVSDSTSASTSLSDSTSTSVSDSASTSTSLSDSTSASTSVSDSTSTSTSLSGSTSASTSVS
ncbi:KxYKxGKxW signal peptide domain-containing protein, partial [Leuconostoc pseudomesenteroides]|uniref:KxYKxGKxW signal peptide domain-containing protein n=2 Tax=Leuconostoc pseudomesenteroides TaxID=33968 RepID=UPI0039EC9E1A